MHPEPESAASETRVLVVDDNADAQSFLTRALGGEAMLVHTAASGKAALGALAHLPRMRCCWTWICPGWTVFPPVPR